MSDIISNDLSEISNLEKKKLAAALARLRSIQRAESFDPYVIDSKPTVAQQQVFNDFGKIKHQYIRAGSQGGKSSSCSRLLAWFVTNSHPTYKHPEGWNKEPVLAIVAGRTSKQIEDSLVPRITAYLEPGTWHAVRLGNIIQRIELTNGARIVFQSLENPTMARERLQSYTAHLAWCDELPPNLSIMAELHRSVQARNGHFLASFTPLTPSFEIQRYVDQVDDNYVHNPSEAYARVYRFNMLDNPVYQDEKRKQEILATLAPLPEKVRRARLYGDWLTGDENVYDVDWPKTVRELPDHYSPALWRHIEGVDPAMSSETGLVVLAEDPRTFEWYVVLAEYVSGVKDPESLVNHLRSMTSCYKIVSRTSDPHEVWFITTANSHGLRYGGVHNKGQRKMELIANLQLALGTKLFLTPNVVKFNAELQNCRWSDRGEGKIVDSSRFHILDACQYVLDNLPRSDVQNKGIMGDGIQAANWSSWLWKANEKRKGLEEARVRGLKAKAAQRWRR